MPGHRRLLRVALVLVLVGGYVAGGLRLADPLDGSPEGAAIDATAPPAEAAHDALTTTETGDYVVESTWRAENGGAELVIRVENSEREAHVRRDRTWGEWPALGVAETYASEHGEWSRLAGRRGPLAWTQSFGEREDRGRFANDRAVLEPGADVRVVARNRSTLVLRVADTDTAYELVHGRENVTDDEDRRERGLRANLTLVVDRETGVLRRSVYRESRLNDTGPHATRRVLAVENRYRDWGEAAVRRPVWVPYTPRELLADLREADG